MNNPERPLLNKVMHKQNYFSQTFLQIYCNTDSYKGMMIHTDTPNQIGGIPLGLIQYLLTEWSRLFQSTHSSCWRHSSVRKFFIREEKSNYCKILLLFGLFHFEITSCSCWGQDWFPSTFATKTYSFLRQNLSPSWTILWPDVPMLFIFADNCFNRWMWHLQVSGNGSQGWTKLVQLRDSLDDILADFSWLSHRIF